MEKSAIINKHKNIIKELEGEVETRIYGVIWKSNFMNGERTDNAAGFKEPSPAVNNGDGSSPFDGIYPWAGMETVEDDKAGTLVKIPKYYYRWSRVYKDDELTSIMLQISSVKQKGFSTSPAHADRGDGERDYVYVGRYHSSPTWKSITGKRPIVEITRSEAREGIKELGDEIYQYDFAMYWTIMMLYLVEYATWDSQSAIGLGCGDGYDRVKVGYTDNMKYHTGTTAASRSEYGGTQYRRIEGLWDNVLDWCDGIRFEEEKIYCFNDPEEYSDTEGGEMIGERATTSGYPKNFTKPTTKGFEYALYPSAVGGSASTHIPDYCSYNSSGVVLRVGGGYVQVQYRGAFYLGGDYAASSSGAAVGCRLQKLPSAS